ncbi:hydroxymethylglutaryl-CoA lyase [Parendozoicomonas haliclonae]|uniref:hydroxymethylglutaryl-CoA lyase n=1 Tax=Parendozoicomonas haliclonae TaxID=1960125 RepID=A0A1X7AN25_9GAMM|nr:hydroxymethylglutaryl-CoA lyase [Parendozoicomonas haliclonae]SMA47889.1 Hydroxymethylglutaryl-CoA lyase YngG [Parendozoicomonas haliclonae]
MNANGLPDSVRLVEVSPRDGLQNQQQILSPEQRVELIRRLQASGLTRIEAGSFVSAERVPAMRDTDQVLAALPAVPGVRYSVLTPNIKGLDAALQAGAGEVAVFTGASETFTRKNIQCSITDSLNRFAPVVDKAKEHNIPVRGYLSCTMGCPYEGEIPLTDVVTLATELFQMGCYEISLGDTIGTGNPARVQELINLLQPSIPLDALAVHFHDTYGQALTNIYAALNAGVRVIDSAVAGLGGCPYAKGASGNVATEDVLYLLNGLGIETGVDMDKLLEATRLLTSDYGYRNDSRVGQALLS